MRKTLECVLRDGSVYFRCARCGQEQVINQNHPLVGQLRQATERHRCSIRIPEARSPLTLLRLDEESEPTRTT